MELAPEGKYRPRTRFARFYNLPELMAMFRETADIKTADQLHLPVPEVEYHTEKALASEEQKQLVQELSDRAAAVHAGQVNPKIDYQPCRKTAPDPALRSLAPFSHMPG